MSKQLYKKSERIFSVLQSFLFDCTLKEESLTVYELMCCTCQAAFSPGKGYFFGEIDALTNWLHVPPQNTYHIICEIAPYWEFCARSGDFLSTIFANSHFSCYPMLLLLPTFLSRLTKYFWHHLLRAGFQKFEILLLISQFSLEPTLIFPSSAGVEVSTIPCKFEVRSTFETWSR